MLKQVLLIVRARCGTVFVVGEHGCAFSYAVCELPAKFVELTAGHFWLAAFSLVLLAGVIMLLVDHILRYFGV